MPEEAMTYLGLDLRGLDAEVGIYTIADQLYLAFGIPQAVDHLKEARHLIDGGDFERRHQEDLVGHVQYGERRFGERIIRVHHEKIEMLTELDDNRLHGVGGEELRGLERDGRTQQLDARVMHGHRAADDLRIQAAGLAQIVDG